MATYAANGPAKTSQIRVTAKASTALAPEAYVALLDPSYSLGAAPSAFGQSLPLAANLVAAAPAPSITVAALETAPPVNVPVPVPAPAELSASQSVPVPVPPPADLAENNEASVPLPVPPPADLENRAAPAAVASLEPDENQFMPMPASPPADLAENEPLPVPRPSDLQTPPSRAPFRMASRQAAPQQNRASLRTAARPDDRNIFEKFFGAPRPSGPVLAYASPEDGFFGNSRGSAAAPASYGAGTAIYDISAHTVYLPNGTRLEAHSGLGGFIDDPHHVDARNRGATPPNVYELTPREQLFHGVRALRLTPIGNSSVYGRTGLLAHTFMLGPRGDSNGCVSFRDYNAFLRAYQSGQVRRLVVVAHL